jgi:hypothetical protein
MNHQSRLGVMQTDPPAADTMSLLIMHSASADTWAETFKPSPLKFFNKKETLDEK